MSLCALGAIGAARSKPYVDVSPPTDSLVFYFPFNSGEINGSNQIANWATGSSVSNSTITTTANGTIDTTNYRCGNGSFVATASGSNVVTLPNFSLTTAFSCSFWLNTPSRGNGTNDNPRVLQFTDLTNTMAIRLIKNASNYTITMDKLSGAQGNFQTLSYATWYHIVCQYSSSTGKIQCYVNGSPSATNSDKNASDTWSINGSMTAAKLVNNSYTFGNIDDFRLYSRVLTATEITNLYNFT